MTKCLVFCSFLSVDEHVDELVDGVDEVDGEFTFVASKQLIQKLNMSE